MYRQSRQALPPTAAVALDFSDQALNVVVLGNHQQQIQLLHALTLPLPKTLVVMHRLVQPEPLLPLLDRLCQHVMPVHAPILLALPSSLVISKEVFLPDTLSSAETARYFQMEIQQLRHADDDLFMDYVRQPVTAGDLQSWLLVACRSDCVTERTAMLARLGLETSVVEVDVHAVARGMRWLQATQIPADECAILGLLLPLEAGLAFTVWRNGRCIYQHELPLHVDNQNVWSDAHLRFARQLMQLYALSGGETLDALWLGCASFESQQLELESCCGIPVRPVVSMLEGALGGADVQRVREPTPDNVPPEGMLPLSDGGLLLRLFGLALRGVGYDPD